MASRKPGRADFASADLTPATGARTTRLHRPQAASFVRAPTDRSQAPRLEPPCDPLARPALLRPPHPHPAFVTIAKRPSFRGWDGQASRGDLPDGVKRKSCPSGCFVAAGKMAADADANPPDKLATPGFWMRS